jgi:hypothetical protein
MTVWVQQGKVFLWRYREGVSNYPGGHLTADVAGCQSLEELLTKFVDTPRNRQAMVRVTRPTEDVLSVPNNRGGKAKWSSPEELQIEMLAESANPVEWRFQPKGFRFQLVAGKGKLLELRDAIRGIPRGKGDFAIGPEDDSPESAAWEDMCLWIWWMPRV